jgi:predicted nicotinamide N-methyase
VTEELVSQSVVLPGGGLTLLQPRESAELPDAGGVAWAPAVPYWSVLWRSGVALARELYALDLRGKRVVELGCGLAVPSIAAARAGAEVLATDWDWEALTLARRNAEANGIQLETMQVDWRRPDELINRGPFDLVLAADLFYEQEGVELLLDLLPRLAPEGWAADPGRDKSASFFDVAERRGWPTEVRSRGVVDIHMLRLA